MAHLLNVVDIRAHRRKKRLKFRAGTETLEVAVLGIPFNPEHIKVRVLDAVTQLVGLAVGRGLQRFSSFLIGALERFSPTDFDFVSSIFCNLCSSLLLRWFFISFSITVGNGPTPIRSMKNYRTPAVAPFGG